MATTSRADQTVGERLARARRRVGLSQARLAAEVDCSESFISKVERGELTLDRLSMARRIVGVLGIPVAELLDLQPQDASTTDQQVKRCDSLPPDLTDEEGGVNRRETLKTAGLLGGGMLVDAVTATLDPDESDRLLAALVDPERPVGERVVRLVEHQDARFQRRTSSLPISQRLEHAQQHLAVVRRLRPAASSEDHQQRLAVVEVQAARLLGRLTGYWLHDPATAARLFRLALATAHHAGPHAATLRAYTLGGMAFLQTELGDRKAAVAAITQALEVAKDTSVRGLPSWLESTAAMAHAGVGDRRACQEALTAAVSRFVPAVAGDPIWLQGFVTPGLLVENRAASYLRLGRPREALAALDEAERLVLARPGRIQQYAVLLAHRAEALVRDRQVVEGCQVAIDALSIAMPIGYGLVVGQIRALWRARLTRHRRQVPAVRELEELLRVGGMR